MPKLTKSNGKYTIDNIHLSQANEMYLECGECLEVDVKVVDKRHITDQQRKFIFALCNEISYYTGADRE